MWEIHKLENNYTTEVLPQEWKFWAPDQAPQPGGLAMGRGVPQEFHRTERKKGSTLGGCTQSLMHTSTQQKKQWPCKSLGHTNQLVLLGLLRSLLLGLLLSRFSHVWLCSTPETAAHQAPLSLGFSRQEHWSGLPLPSPMHESEKWKWSRSVVSDS